MVQAKDHWLKKAVSLVWAKSSLALIHHSYPVMSSMCLAREEEHRKRRALRRRKDDAVLSVNLWATSFFSNLHPLEFWILGLHRSIIHLICLCTERIRSAAHWLIWSIFIDLGSLSDSPSLVKLHFCVTKLSTSQLLLLLLSLSALPIGPLLKSGGKAKVRLSFRLED